MSVRLLLAAIGATAMLAASAGPAAADPVNSPKAFKVAMRCDGGGLHAIREFTLLANPSPPGWTATTSVGIAVYVAFTDTTTGEVFVERDVPGFDANAVGTETCVGEFPEFTLTVRVLLTPANQ